MASLQFSEVNSLLPQWFRFIALLVYSKRGQELTGLVKCVTPDLAEMVIFIPGRAVGKTRWTCLLLSLALLARTA